MIDTAEQTYDTPEATAAAVLDIARSAPNDFGIGSIPPDGPLFAAAVHHTSRDKVWLDYLVDELRKAKVPVRSYDAMAKAIRARSKDAERSTREGRGNFRTIGPDDGPPLVHAALGRDAPTPSDAAVPAGYQLSRNGITIRQPDGSTAPVSPRAIVISGALVDQTSGMERFVLSWWDGLRWRKRVVDRGVAMNRAKITQEANYGLRVDSENAAATVRYLSAYENTNDLVTPRLTTTSHLGWQEGSGESASTFLCGTTVLRPGGDAEAATTAANILAPETWHPDALVFHAKSDGDTQLASAFTPVGTYEAWRETVRPLADYLVPQFGLYASFAAPVLALLGASPFLVDICGQTSRGKTTSLQGAASVWGNPDPTAGGLIGSWNNTGNYVSQVAQMLNGLPILLDDTSQGKPKEIPQLIYMLANGRGRGRMERTGGTQEVGSWETITLSTGETPLVSYSQDGGTRGRVLTLWGSPFGTDTDGRVVAQLKADLKTNYGHAGPRFVQYLLDHYADWPRWRQAYRDAVAEYITKNDGSPVANRLAEHAAVIRLTAVLAHEIDLLPWDYRDPVEPLWPMLLQGASDADRATDALRLVHSWAVEHRTQFDGQFRQDSTGSDIIPHSVLGTWKTDGDRIAFSQGPLKKVLADAEFPVDGVLRTWGDRGWLDLGKDKNGTTLTKAARVQGVTTRCYVVPMEAFTAVEASDPTEVAWRIGQLDDE